MDLTVVEKGEAPEDLHYIGDITVWENTAEEVFEKGEKIIWIILKAGFAIKQSGQRICPGYSVFRRKMARWMLLDSS